jgi:D-beta-D-heptose 7-phosphate kinase/D-beta-D-heptose 1-phosphate adenosyltransferase
MAGKVVTAGALHSLLAAARRAKKKIVFTNGCFDILHVGHLKTFRQCKKWGDLLVVGVNADQSVRGLEKGPGRPIVPQRDRAELLAALDPVDYVVIFNEPTPAKLIKAVRPDILAKGGDWKLNEIVGREHAGAVKRIPLVKGRSTTNIIERVLKAYGRSTSRAASASRRAAA